MTRGWVVAVACGALAAGIGLAGQQQPPPRDTRTVATTGTAAIGGTVVVVEESGARPVTYAHVGILGIDSGIIRVTSSDAAGRFQLPQLPAGRYLIGGFKPPYVAMVYGAKKPGRAGTAIAVADGEARTDLVLTLARGGVITGVISDDAGNAVPGIGVTATPAAGGSLQSQMMSMAFLPPQVSDDRGLYRFSGLPAGDYVVTAMRTDRIDPDARAVTSAEIDEAMRLLREPPAAVASSGARASGPVEPAETRIVPAAGGVGGASMTGAMPMLASMMMGRGRGMSYAPVYYPGTVDIGEARPVKVAAGEERTGIDILARAVPTSAVEGIVLGLDGHPAPGASLRLRSSGQSELVTFALAMLSSLAPTASKDGTFRMTGVAPGRYTLEARTYDGGVNAAAIAAGAAAGFTPPKPRAFGSTDVVVTSGQPLTGVEVRLQPGSRVTGTVVFRPAALTPPKDASNVLVSLVPSTSNDPLSMISSGVARAAADGTFALEAVIPGRYVLSVGVAEPTQMLQWMPQSVTVNGRELLDLPIEILPGQDVGGVVVTLGDVQQSVQGGLQDASGRPASEYTILLFPVDRAYWLPNSRRVLSTRPATDGRFSFAGPLGPPPGRYHLAALTDLDPQEQYKPAVLEEIAQSAITIVVQSGRGTQQDIRIARE